MPNLVGQSLGRYHILEQLGEGGMATVYKAYDTRLERDVAVKVIRVDQFGAGMLERILKRFEREAKALAKLTHPNIVHINDYGEQDGIPYLVMDYLPGGTLKQILGKPIPWQEVTHLLIPITRALDYAHNLGIIHRDVKPSNILITQSGEPMLSDFGIAKILESEETQTLTGAGVGIGTPEYMAPEQWTGHACPQSDLYSLGVVLFEMVTGRKPYIADTPAAILLKQANDLMPRPRQFVPDLPEAVEKVLFKTLAKKPEDRYQSMGEFAKALEGLDAVLPTEKTKEQYFQQERPLKVEKPAVAGGNLNWKLWIPISIAIFLFCLILVFGGWIVSMVLKGNSPVAHLAIIPPTMTPTSTSTTTPTNISTMIPTNISTITPTSISIKIPLPVLISTPVITPALTSTPTAMPSATKYALKFDGVDDYVSIVDAGNFAFGNAFSVEAWVKPLSLSGSGTYKAIVQGAFSEPPFSGAGWSMFLNSSNYSDWGLSVCVPECQSAKSGAGSLKINQWQHLAGTYDGSEIVIYQNGQKITSTPQSGNVTHANFVLLGRWVTSFNGLIDEVRIWNIARTQAEIQSNMNHVLTGNEPGLVGYWRLDEGSGQAVFDGTSGHNDGRLGSSSASDGNDPTWVVSDAPIP